MKLSLCLAVAFGAYVASSACVDKVIDGEEWVDSYGTGCSSTWYSTKNKCKSSSDEESRNMGFIGLEACCACGGGDEVADDPSAECVRDDGWYSEDGYSCTDFLDPSNEQYKFRCTDALVKKSCCPECKCVTDYDWKHSVHGDTCDDFAPGAPLEKFACDDEETKKACCFCGRHDGCTDRMVAGEEWHDDGGPRYTCFWYNKRRNKRCGKMGHKYPWGGMTANYACCACGGGERTHTCADKAQGGTKDGPEWHDDGGPAYTCEYYGKKKSRCAKNGHKFEMFGMTANDACCACGGGIKEKIKTISDQEGEPQPDLGDDLQNTDIFPDNSEWCAGVKFYNKKHLQGDMVMYWNVDMEQETVTFGMLGPTGSSQNNFWVSLGVSPTGGMAGSDVLTVWWENDEPVVMDQYLESQSYYGVKTDGTDPARNGRQQARDIQTKRYTDRLSFAWTRPLEVTVTGAVGIKPDEEYAKMIYSFGSVDREKCTAAPMCNHDIGDRWSAQVALMAPAYTTVYELNKGTLDEPCHGPAQVECQTGFTCYHSNLADEFANSYEFYGQCKDPAFFEPDPDLIEDNWDCIQRAYPIGQGGFEHEVALRGCYVMLYTMNMQDPEKKKIKQGDSITVAVISTAPSRVDGWIGFGWSPNGEMKGSDVVIGWMDGDNTYIGDYHLAAQVPTQNKPDNKQEIDRAEFRVFRKNGQIAVNFRRPLVPADSVQFLPGNMHVIFGNGELPDGPPADDSEYVGIPYHRYRANQQHAFIELDVSDDDFGKAAEMELCLGPTNIECVGDLVCLPFPDEMFEIDWDQATEDTEGFTSNSDFGHGGKGGGKGNPFSNITNLKGRGMCLGEAVAANFADMDLDNLGTTTTIDPDEYDEHFQLRWGFDVYWKYLNTDAQNEEDVKIKIAIVANLGPGYLAIGFGGYGMIGCTSVLGWAMMEDSSDITVDEYHHVDKLPWDVRPVSEQGLYEKSLKVEDMSVNVIGPETAVVFTRPVLLPDFPEADINRNGQTPVIVAIGNTPGKNDDYFGYHRYRESKAINFKYSKWVDRNAESGADD